MTRTCQFCGKEFEAYHAKTQRYCSRRCREKGEYQAAKESGKLAERVARKRALKELRKRTMPKIAVKAKRLREMGLTPERRQEIEWEMSLPREQLMKKSRRWTAKERRYAQRAWETKHGLFRGRWD